MASRIIVAIALLALAALAPVVALAAQPEPDLALGFPAKAKVGERIVLSAYLMDPAGNPISDQKVAFSTEAEFMNTLGTVEIGSAKTDEKGLAYLLYTPKSEGDQTITVKFAGNSVFASASATKPLTVTPGTASYEEERPFRIPGADIRLVVFALSLAWGLYLIAASLIWLISRSGAREAAGPGGSP